MMAQGEEALQLYGRMQLEGVAPHDSIPQKHGQHKSCKYGQFREALNAYVQNCKCGNWESNLAPTPSSRLRKLAASLTWHWAHPRTGVQI